MAITPDMMRHRAAELEEVEHGGEVVQLRWAADEIERLRAALQDAAAWDCTCHEAYVSRCLTDPQCMADLVGDDARAALGQAPVCRGRAAIRAAQ